MRQGALWVEELPEVEAALETGELSLGQAKELVRTEAACPGSAVGLLGVAKEQSLKTLKDEARDRRTRAIDPEELHRLQHEAMSWRLWRTRLGTVAFAGELPPEFGVPIANRIDAETDRLWKQARQQANQHADQATNGIAAISGADAASGVSGRAQPRRAALAAQAFLRLVETGGKGKAHSADLVIVCDLQAYRRGHAHDGEPCHIVGGGPIPVSLARELGKDVFLKAVLHDGVNIHTVAHFGRKLPAVLRTALTLGAPPLFNGITCSKPSCDRQFHLEEDHIDPVANGGLSAYENYQPLCWPHHQVKTEQDRKAGLLRGGGAGARRPRERARRARGPDPP